MSNIEIIDHPLALHDLSLIRDKDLHFEHFKAILRRISALIAIKATEDLPLIAKEVTTPMESTSGHAVGCDIIATPILRAGLGMLDGFLQAVPYARTALVGMKRDEKTFEGIEYLYSLPESTENSIFFVLDVMLATGISLVESLKKLEMEKHKEIRILNVLATPEGVERLNREFPKCKIFTVSIDREMNERKYILPGLGDAGDRIFGTL